MEEFCLISDLEHNFFMKLDTNCGPLLLMTFLGNPTSLNSWSYRICTTPLDKISMLINKF